MDPHTIDLYDPDGSVAAAPHEVFAPSLRREHPVFRQAMPGGTGLAGRPMRSNLNDAPKDLPVRLAR
jgi:hypothetical protein